jgi:oligopeptide/dipeptide ABC transporter ATP-binding protein
MQKLRGNEIAMIFQEPMTALNPVYTIGDQISEVYLTHRQISKKEAWDQSIEMLQLVGIPSPEKRVSSYPHQLSGGMRQRAMIAMALACRPKLLIADEPTTALDVTIQDQILELMYNLQQELGTSIQFITHDLGVVSELSDEVVVMYAGTVVERASAKTIFTAPKHPYTVGLMESIPSATSDKNKELFSIPGVVPSLLDLPVGCRFQDRCRFATDACKQAEPTLEEQAPGHQVACFNPVS